MKYAVEARIYDNGKIEARVRKALPGKRQCYMGNHECDVWIDLFDSRQEAEVFAGDYAHA